MLKQPAIRAFKTGWFGKAAKKARITDQALIAADELTGFKKLAQAYSQMTDGQIAAALREGDLQELSDAQQIQI